MTACKDCKFRIIDKSNGDHIWYNNTCGAVENDMDYFDCITGEMTRDQKHPHCRSINKGDCKYFEEK